MTKHEFRGVVAGMILGDANIQLREGYKNPTLRMNHSIKQKEYFNHKITLLQPHFHYDLMKSYKEKSIKNKSNNKTYKVCSLFTRVSPKLKTLWKATQKGKYHKNLLKYLTPQGLAIWYMDDGSYTKQRRTVMLSTYSSYEENKVLVDYFKERWNIEWKIAEHKGKYHLLRGHKSDDMKRFMELIRPYVIPSMRYKLVFTANTTRNGNDIVRHS